MAEETTSVTEPTDEQAPTPQLSAEQLKRVAEVVKENGADRAKAQPIFNEVDYIAGAMAVLFALDCQAKIPSLWIFGPMLNREIIPGSAKKTAIAHAAADLYDALKSVAYTAGDGSTPPSRRLEAIEEVAEKALRELKGEGY